MRRLNLVLCLMTLSLFAAKAQGNLQLINISPDTSMNLVSVSLEDSVLVDSLAFNEATAYLLVPEGANQTLTFTSVNNPLDIYELTNLDIQFGKFYQSILTGVINTEDYEVNPEGISLDTIATWKDVDTTTAVAIDTNVINIDTVIVNGDTTIAGDTIITTDTLIRVNFFHGISDMVELDIYTIQQDKIIDNISYKEYSDTSVYFKYKNTVTLFVTNTDGSVPIANRDIVLSEIEGKTLTIFFSGFTIPSDNNNGPVINYYSVDEVGNVNVLPFPFIVSVTESFELLQNIKYYPNPATDFTFIEFNNSNLSDISISIVDLSGKTISNEAFDLNNGFNKLKIDLPNLPNGLYFLNLTTLGSQSTLPLVIAK